MRSMRLESSPGRLIDSEVHVPRIDAGQILLRVEACGVCRTDLHLIDGELPDAALPVTPGHQIVGVIESRGAAVANVTEGERVGVPWLGWTCGECDYCRSGRENLCDRARFTGCHIDGGYAQYAAADARYCFRIPETWSAADAAPLLCAGLIGYRAYRFADDARRIGMYGFGSAAHILAQIGKAEGREVFAFTRPGDLDSQNFARSLGAKWAGGSDEDPGELLDAAIIFAPAGPLVPAALARVRKGGGVICAGIHMSDIPSFPYELLWGERSIRSVANLTRRDGVEFFEAVSRMSLKVEVKTYVLGDANAALDDLRAGRLQGSAVLVVE